MITGLLQVAQITRSDLQLKVVHWFLVSYIYYAQTSLNVGP